jgi:hypothetical protein
MEGKACEGDECHVMDAIAGDHKEVVDRKKKSLSLNITQDQLSHTDDDDATIYQRCAERLKGSHKMESLIEAMCHNESNDFPSVRMSNDQEQEEKALTLSENHDVCEGLQLLDRVEDLHTKYAVAEHNTKVLELNLLDLTEKIRLLEGRIQEQEHNIHEAQTYQTLADYDNAQCQELEATEDEDEPSPIRIIYLRQFHDHVRDAICRKLAETTLWGRHYKALQRQVAAAAGSKGVRGHNRLGKLADRKSGLWEFAQEAHSIAPCTFKKGV